MYLFDDGADVILEEEYEGSKRGNMRLSRRVAQDTLEHSIGHRA